MISCIAAVCPSVFAESQTTLIAVFQSTHIALFRSTICEARSWLKLMLVSLIEFFKRLPCTGKKMMKHLPLSKVHQLLDPGARRILDDRAQWRGQHRDNVLAYHGRV
jgi:hypothetical protein